MDNNFLINASVDKVEFLLDRTFPPDSTKRND